MDKIMKLLELDLDWYNKQSFQLIHIDSREGLACSRVYMLYSYQSILEFRSSNRRLGLSIMYKMAQEVLYISTQYDLQFDIVDTFHKPLKSYSTL